ncbi:MAG: NAD(P)(+) transhydrogenase (Re/Si-specific) subunit beta [Clostridiales bacterium]|nr:NAD(P)(+) transhydrogenase (Re/Si-specific) subunit beta [Clostridiales bacterium]
MNLFGFQEYLCIFLYMIASVLFIMGIKKLGKADTARSGNLMSSIGMLIAVISVLISQDVIPAGIVGYGIIACAIVIGSVIGFIWAKKVEMTGMPQLVALFNGFGGLSSMLVAISQYLALRSGSTRIGSDPFTSITMGLTIVIGAVAFTGSLIAWGKLAGLKIFKKPISLPGKNVINSIILVVAVGGIGLYTYDPTGNLGFIGIIVTAVASLILGVTLVITIGGGDMPVIISFLNALSGLAAAFAGFPIGNTVLIVSGCLVGASGVILTLIMCKAMNRTFASLLFKSVAKKKSSATTGEQKEPRAMSVEDAYLVLEAAKNVVIVPGYGMAVAQAQHAVKELCDKLEDNGSEVNFAIHPVAGRMPGHMNVLLAEANVPYEMLKTSDDMNPQMDNVDVAIIIGANDVVNPSAVDDESSPLYGMPIVEAFRARTVFVLKRGKGTGFSGIENPLFTNDNTVMIYGDAKQTVSSLVSEFDS